MAFNAQTVAEITKIAEARGLEPAALLAVAEVESAGIPFWTVNGKRVPPVRPEGHYFYKNLSGSQRTRAVNARLASPKAGAVKVPGSWSAVYAMVARMKAINEDAALMSCSWGLGQVMGQWWSDLGYSSVQDLVRACSTVGGQVDLMVRFIIKNHLDDELKGHKWAAFARAYNGPGYKKNRYDTKMAAAYKKYASGKGPKPKTPDPLVQEYQNQLITLGYDPGPADGFYGKQTKTALMAFQREHNLVVDGLFGPMTDRALDEAVSAKQAKAGDAAVRTGATATAVSATGAVVLEQVKPLQDFAESMPMIGYVVAAITVVGIALVCYGLYKRLKA